MIKINALFFLLTIEVSVILAATVVFLVLRMKKIGNLYRVSVKALNDARSEQKQFQKQLAEAAAVAAAPPAEPQKEQKEPAPEPGPSTKPSPDQQEQEFENCKVELSIVKKKLEEKNASLNSLQAKFDDLEKEYLILYHQQHNQEK